MPPYKFYLKLSVLTVVFAILLSPVSKLFQRFMSSSSSSIPNSASEWKAALDALPATPNSIPAFFFAHGSPALAMPPSMGGALGRSGITSYQGPSGPLASFLKLFGPALLGKYKPKGILVFSAHWETLGERLVTDYGDENPLLMDYYGFPDEVYQLKFKSRGDKALSERVVQLFKDAGFLARTTSTLEPRGEDGRGFSGPGFDHGVFVPFRLMFGDEFTDIPIVEASIDSTLSPDGNWKIGKAVAALRKEGYLVLSGGLPIHNLRDFSTFHPDTTKPVLHEFHKAILDAVSKSEVEERKAAMTALTKHNGFRLANPREEHFVPLYIAAGAAEEGGVRVLNGLYGIPTVAFGVEEN